MNSIVTSIDDKNVLPTQLEALNIFELLRIYKRSVKMF